jgi:hypothetical protein
MKTFLLLTFLWAGCSAFGQSSDSWPGTVIGAGSNGIPFCPVNHSGQQIEIAVADASFNPQYYLYVPSDAHGELEWVCFQPGWVMVVESRSSGTQFSLDTSGTNANFCQFVWDVTQSYLNVFQASGVPPVPGTTVGMTDAEFNWFKAGFGLALGFLGFGWCLRMTKNIGRASPDM